MSKPNMSMRKTNKDRPHEGGIKSPEDEAKAIGQRVKEARKPWQMFDAQLAEAKKGWQPKRAEFIALVLAQINAVLDDGPRWMRTLAENPQEQLVYDLRKAQFEAAARVAEAYHAATQEAKEKGQDAVAAGFNALFEACGDLTPVAAGELMTSGHDYLSEISTYLLSGGIVRHISLSTNLRLKRFFTSQSQDPKEGLHEEMPAALRQAHAERPVSPEPLSTKPLLKGPFLSAVTNAMMGKTASVNETEFPRNAETGEPAEVGGLINSVLTAAPRNTADFQNLPNAETSIDDRDFLLSLAAEASLSENLRSLFDQYLEDGLLIDRSGNKELAERLGRTASKIANGKMDLLNKLRATLRKRSD